MNYISHYHSDDKMCLLICDNPQILPVLSRFDINLGFSNKDIEKVCEENGVDTNTFLAIVNMLLCGDKSDHIDYSHISVDTLLQYLKSSHVYHVDYRLPNIRKELIRVMDTAVAPKVVELVVKYFDDYTSEVVAHLRYEEDVVFSYINSLMSNVNTEGYSISEFSENHHNVDEKLNELKDIVLKYLPAKSTDELLSVLSDIFRCSKELQMHNDVEDYLLIPLIEYLEKTSNYGS